MDRPPVKSAMRVMQLMELFAQHRRRMTTSEIAQAHHWPLSSTHALLRSMTELGYLTLRERDVSYFPSLRLSRLADWIPAAIFEGRQPRELIRALRDSIGETVTLSSRRGMTMEFHEIVVGTLPVSMTSQPGDRFPLFSSAVGLTALSAMGPSQVRELMALPEARTVGGLTDAAALDTQLKAIRSRGRHVAYDSVVEGLSAIAWALTGGGRYDDIFVIAIAGPTGRIRAQERRIIAAAEPLIEPFRSADGALSHAARSPAPRDNDIAAESPL